MESPTMRCWSLPFLCFVLCFFVTPSSSGLSSQICSSGTLSTTCYINNSLSFLSPGAEITGCGNLVITSTATLECQLPSLIGATLGLVVSLLQTPFPPCEIRIAMKGTITIDGVIKSQGISLAAANVNVSSTGILDTTARGYGSSQVKLDLGSLLGLGALVDLSIWPGPAVGAPLVDLTSLIGTLSLSNIVSILQTLTCKGGGGGGHYGSGGKGACCLLGCLGSNEGGKGAEFLTGNNTADDSIDPYFVYGSGSGGGYGGRALLLELPLICTPALILSPGGAGGGKIKIITDYDFNLNGKLLSKGQNVISGSNSVGGPGGGGGGSVAIDVNRIISTTGIIDVSGGSGGDPGGGGGGGGFITIYSLLDIPGNSLLSLIANGGPGNNCGTNGNGGKITTYNYRRNQYVQNLNNLNLDFVNYQFFKLNKPDLSIIVNDAAINNTNFGDYMIENYDNTTSNDTLDLAKSTAQYAKFQLTYDLVSEVNVESQSQTSGLLYLITSVLKVVELLISAVIQALNMVTFVLDIVLGALRVTLTLQYESFNDQKQNCKISMFLDPWTFSSNISYVRYKFYVYSIYGITNYTYDYVDNNTIFQVMVENDYNWKFFVNYSTEILLSSNNSLFSSLLFDTPTLLNESVPDEGSCSANVFPEDQMANVVVISMLVPYFREAVFIDPNLQVLFGGGSRSDDDDNNIPIDITTTTGRDIHIASSIGGGTTGTSGNGLTTGNSLTTGNGLTSGNDLTTGNPDTTTGTTGTDDPGRTVGGGSPGEIGNSDSVSSDALSWIIAGSVVGGFVVIVFVVFVVSIVVWYVKTKALAAMNERRSRSPQAIVF